jgi:hypothetical protein
MARARRRYLHPFGRRDRGTARCLVVRMHSLLIERISYAEHATKRVVFGSRSAIEWIGHYDGTAAVLVDCLVTLPAPSIDSVTRPRAS